MEYKTQYYQSCFFNYLFRTNAKAELKKQLPNTGTKDSGLLALLGASVGLLALAGKRKYNR